MSPIHCDYHSDSESDDEEYRVNSKYIVERVIENRSPGIIPTKIIGNKISVESQLNLEKLHLSDIQPQGGRLSDLREAFASLQAIKSYPFVFVGKANSKRVAERFYDAGKFYTRTWDLFYLHRRAGDGGRPVILVPTHQFESFLDEINKTLSINLTIPSGARAGFAAQFDEPACPRPRFLGHSTTRDEMDGLKDNIPGPKEVPIDEDPKVTQSLDLSHAALKVKIDAMLKVGAARGGRGNGKDRKALDRAARQQAWGDMIRRVQRYVGLCTEDIAETTTANNRHPHSMENDVIFISVDVEAYELSSSMITEVGIATLDTRDLVDAAPGKLAVHWREKIRARHFRIDEYKHYINSRHVEGCPDRFEFGTSEFIVKADITQTIATCFKYPQSSFASSSGSTQQEEYDEQQQRAIVLVGHNIAADIDYLRRLGSSVYKSPQLRDTIDTTHMWQHVTGDINPRSLDKLLCALEITPWNLHNAGNDAVYTLQAMLGIAVGHAAGEFTAGVAAASGV